MRRTVSLVTALVAGWVIVAAAQQPSVLPMGPARERRAAVTRADEGWYKNDDDSFSMLLGYYNRNSKETLTFRSARTNKIEPGDPKWPADLLRNGPPVGRVRHQGPEGLWREGDQVDARLEWRNPDGAVYAQQGISLPNEALSPAARPALNAPPSTARVLLLPPLRSFMSSLANSRVTIASLTTTRLRPSPEPWRPFSARR